LWNELYSTRPPVHPVTLIDGETSRKWNPFALGGMPPSFADHIQSSVNVQVFPSPAYTGSKTSCQPS
jgi:hypothetical protein